jgi:hypothetical protein
VTIKNVQVNGGDCELVSAERFLAWRLLTKGGHEPAVKPDDRYRNRGMRAARRVIAIAGVFAATGPEPENGEDYKPSIRNRHATPLGAASIPFVVARCAYLRKRHRN